MPTAELAYTPHAHQLAIHRKRRRFTVVVAHRRFGKTVAAIGQLCAEAIRCAHVAGRFGYLAPFRNQAKAVAWDYLTRFTRGIPGVVVNESELWVEVPNAGGHTSRVRLYGADNADALRGGYFDGVVLDEVADMRPNVWGEIVRPMLADRMGWALFIGTPKGVNLFSELFYAAVATEGWTALRFPASKTGIVAPAELEDARRMMTPAQFAQEFECDFSAARDDALIPLDVARAALGRTYDATAYTFAPKVLGIDVARMGGDRTVLQQRQGLVALAPIVRQGRDNMEVAALAANVIGHWQPDAVFVDAGRGEGVIDRLRQLGHDVIEVPFGGTALSPRYENRKAEMWATMADWLKQGGSLAAGEHAEALVADLTAVTYDYANARGRFAIESKDDLRKRGLRSPDLADALALTFAAPVAPKVDAHTGLPFARATARTDYDPFAR